MGTNLRDKNILFISPSFFGYETEIKNKLQELGANVFFIDDRPNNSGIIKAIIRTNIGRKIIKNKLKRYFLNKLTQWSKIDFDYVFVNTPESFTDIEIINIYKTQLHGVPFILYMWDSLNNRKNTKDILHFFDKKFTFDKEDAKLLNLNFRPLFFTDKYKDSLPDYSQIDVCFIGTAHTDRYLFVKKTIEDLGQNLKSYCYFYLQNPFLYVYNKVSNKEFRSVLYRDICFKSLSSTSVANTIIKSKIIIDIHHPRQTGLTMRTIEVLGAKKKLITTNKDVINYDFFNSNNVYIVDRLNPKIDLKFLELPYMDISQEIYRKYSLQGWIEEIFFQI